MVEIAYEKKSTKDAGAGKAFKIVQTATYGDTPVLFADQSAIAAWLMRDAVAAVSLASPPDIIITVGNSEVELQSCRRNYGYQFVAHKHLVSLHSGYLKSLINNESSHNASSITAISLPSISPDAFAPLLSFMYTGFLDLTNENIYSVLLATHLLHMPRALDLCRAYLVQNQAELHRNPDQRSHPFQFQNNPNIIKPIPSRKVQNIPHPFWPPMNVPPLFLHTSPNGPFQSVSPADNQEPTVTEQMQQHQEPKSPLAIPSTSKTDVVLSPTSSATSPCPTNMSCTSDERTVHIIKSPQRKSLKRKDNHGKSIKKVNNENLKVVLDVACCDGPVRFHRVLNECYGMSLDELIDDPDSDKNEQNRDNITDKEYLDNYPKTQFLNLKSNKKFSNFMHQQMLNSNLFKKSKSTKGVIQLRKVIEKEILTQDRPSQDENETEAEAETEDDQAGRIYTCMYCKHTFKSQYCYQKHAKRHINPVEDSSGSSKNLVIVRKVVSTTKTDGKDGGCGNVRREVRLLDMNVQYYPCKTCGSKFPSYYFVHKHRKMCHSGDDNIDENSNHQTEDCDM